MKISALDMFFKGCDEFEVVRPYGPYSALLWADSVHVHTACPICRLQESQPISKDTHWVS